DPLHGREVLVDLGAQLGEALLERRELLGHVHGRLARYAPHLLDLALELEARALKIESMGRHGQVVRTRWTRSRPTRSRNAPSRSSAASTRSERLRSRATSPGVG